MHRLGKRFASSTGFKLPNGATRSPDVAWVKRDRWESLTSEQHRKFVPLSPDFVIELRPLRYLRSSAISDELTDLQAKMQEYLENGLQLSWLIDPETKRVEIYRCNSPVEVLNHPQTLSEEAVLPGFVLDLSEIF